MDIQDIVKELSELSKTNQQLSEYTENIESFFGRKLASDDALKAAVATYRVAKNTEDAIQRLVYTIQGSLEGIYQNNKKLPASEISPKATTHLEKALTVAQKELATAKKNVVKLEKAYKMIAKKTAPTDIVDTMKEILKGLKKHLVKTPTTRDFAYDYYNESYQLTIKLAPKTSISIHKEWDWYAKARTLAIKVVVDDRRAFSIKTAQEAVDWALKNLKEKGSPLLKENAGVGALVQSSISEIVKKLNLFVKSKEKDGYGSKTKYNANENTITSQIKTHIRSEYGQYDDDEYDYMAESYHTQPLKELMRPYMNVIFDIDVVYSEKGWFTLIIELKG